LVNSKNHETPHYAIFPASCYFLSLKPKTHSSASYHQNTHSLCSSPNVTDQDHTHTYRQNNFHLLKIPWEPTSISPFSSFSSRLVTLHKIIYVCI
jgi:hypothetical protein